jgi:hypothetical protein
VVNQHHVTYRSQGGTETQPTHKACHVALHSSRNDFRVWGQQGGKRSAATLRWAFNLKNVSRHPAYESHRWSYLINNGLVGWGEGLI